MTVSHHDFDALAREHETLMSAYGEAQSRCSELIARQAAEIEDLRASAIRLRGALIARDTALAWAHEDRRALEARVPGLPARAALADSVALLSARLRALTLVRSEQRAEASIDVDAAADGGNLDQLEASLAAADLVICQTGCLGHGDYWRVKDYCRRTGKTCVVVEQPRDLRIVRIHDRRGNAATLEETSP